jgi:hypothetical protein
MILYAPRVFGDYAPTYWRVLSFDIFPDFVIVEVGGFLFKESIEPVVTKTFFLADMLVVDMDLDYHSVVKFDIEKVFASDDDAALSAIQKTPFFKSGDIA